MQGGHMSNQNEGISGLQQHNISWINDAANNKHYFTEKYKLLILKRNLEHNTFQTGITLKINRREK